MAVSALPSNALYDVQKYLRQKRATGAQVTPQNERSAWSGYFDTMEANSLAERRFALLSQTENERMKLAKEAQENAEGAAAISGVGQLLSAGGQGAMLLKGTSLGAKMGLGPATVAPGAAPGAAVSSVGGASPTLDAYSTGAKELAGTTAGAAPTTAGAVSATAPTGAAYSTGAAELAGTEAAASAVGAETGLISTAAPYLGPAGVGFAAGSIIPGLLGFNKGKGELAAGVVSGAAAGAAYGSMVAPGPGTIVGGIIGAVAGGIGAKIK